MTRHKINPTLLNAWEAALQQTCAQNAAVELVPMTEAGETLPLVRARLLDVGEKDGVLIVEKPGNLPQAQALQKDTPVELVLVSASSRMKAKSRVIDVGLYRLNKQTKVTAVRLSPVEGVASAQRRSCFRLSTLGIAIRPVQLVHEAWPEDQTPLKATMVDISDRGMGVSLRMETELAEKMKGQEYQLTVHLPDEPEPMELQGRVVRVIETAFHTVSLGIQFEFTGLTQQRRVERVIQQFSVAQQRKQLRRMRGAG